MEALELRRHGCVGFGEACRIGLGMPVPPVLWQRVRKRLEGKGLEESYFLESAQGVGVKGLSFCAFFVRERKSAERFDSVGINVKEREGICWAKWGRR